jgi:hypothetical protein
MNVPAVCPRSIFPALGPIRFTKLLRSRGDVTSPLAPNSRRRISKSGASVSVSGSFRRRAQDELDGRNEKDYKKSMNRRQVELLA